VSRFAGFCLLVAALGASLHAGRDLVPPARRVAWRPGIIGGVPAVPVAVNVRDFGARGDGVTDDAAAFRAAIGAVRPPGAVSIPAGTYLLRSSLRMRSGVVLRGAGAAETHLVINHDGVAIDFSLFQRGAWVNAIDGYSKGSSVLAVADASRFTAGGYGEIQQDNDPLVMYTSPDWDQTWARNAVGQVFRVAAVDGNRLLLDTPLHVDFDPRLHPIVRPQGLLENSGLEDLHLRRADRSDTNMVSMTNVANVWMVGVLSELAAKSHVYVNTGYRVEVRDSEFDDASDHGGGGHGYGVELIVHTADALVQNNIFRRLRHSMMVHVGATGNVFGYNYSREPEGVSQAADISVHGHYPSANLFEGNVVQGVAVTDFWGPAGPHNLFFRNRVELAGIRLADASHHQNIVGNEVAGGRIVRDATVDPATLLVHGNRVDGAVGWDPSIDDQALPDSYYLVAKPEFFGAMEWPSTGSDRPEGLNPAKRRFASRAAGTRDAFPTRP
jgi:hypothetical protein